MEIKGKKAVVVGGASGMARASAELLHERGASVAILDLPSSAGAEVAASLDGSFHPVDVTDAEGVELALADAVANLGGLHIAVNTAGGGTATRTLSKARSASARRVPAGDRAQPDRHLQPEPAAGVPHVEQRARGRRARRHHRHRVDRRVRRPDRPGRVHRGQGRHRRDDAHDGARPRQPRHPGRRHRTELVQHRASPKGSPTSSRRS